MAEAPNEPTTAREARGKDNRDLLTECVRDARAALSATDAPTPERDNPLYYPLLFITEAVERVLRDTLRSAYEDMRAENEAAAAWINAATQATRDHTEPRP